MVWRLMLGLECSLSPPFPFLSRLPFSSHRSCSSLVPGAQPSHRTGLCTTTRSGLHLGLAGFCSAFFLLVRVPWFLLRPCSLTLPRCEMGICVSWPGLQLTLGPETPWPWTASCWCSRWWLAGACVGWSGGISWGVALHELVQEMVISRTDVLADGGVVLTVSLCLVISTSLLAEWRSVWP